MHRLCAMHKGIALQCTLFLPGLTTNDFYCPQKYFDSFLNDFNNILLDFKTKLY